MILPAMGLVSEVSAGNARERSFPLRLFRRTPRQDRQLGIRGLRAPNRMGLGRLTKRVHDCCFHQFLMSHKFLSFDFLF
jgi:hypothetical protein